MLSKRRRTSESANPQSRMAEARSLGQSPPKPKDTELSSCALASQSAKSSEGGSCHNKSKKESRPGQSMCLAEHHNSAVRTAKANRALSPRALYSGLDFTGGAWSWANDQALAPLGRHCAWSARLMSTLEEIMKAKKRAPAVVQPRLVRPWLMVCVHACILHNAQCRRLCLSKSSSTVISPVGQFRFRSAVSSNAGKAIWATNDNSGEECSRRKEEWPPNLCWSQ